MSPFRQLKNAKTLLVDDDEFIRDSLSMAFHKKGCTMRVVETAEEGLEVLHEETFDIIISDFCLPGIDGLKFLKMAGMTHPQAVKFLITAYKDDHIFTEAIRMGVHEFIEKPFAVKTFIERMMYTLKKSKKKRSKSKKKS